MCLETGKSGEIGRFSGQGPQSPCFTQCLPSCRASQPDYFQRPVDQMFLNLYTGGISVRKILFFIIIAHAYLCGGVLGSEYSPETAEQTPDPEFVSMVKDVLSRSTGIRIRYIPMLTAWHVTRYGYDYADTTYLSKLWRYEFEKRCLASCGEENALARFITSGRRFGGSCPGPYYAMVEWLGSSGSIVETIYVDMTFRCFKLAKESYISGGDFRDALEAFLVNSIGP